MTVNNEQPNETPEDPITPEDQQNTETTDDQDLETTDTPNTEQNDDDTDDEEESAPEATDEESEDDDAEEPNPDEDTPDPKDKARSDYNARQQSKFDTRLSEVEKEQRKVISELDPKDPDFTLKRLEANDRIREAREIVREVRSNQESLRNDGIAVASIPMFNPEDKDNFNADAYELAETEFLTNYVQAAGDPENPEIVGAFDPITGEPVSFYEFMQKKAAEYAPIAKAAAIRGQQTQRRMQHTADDPGSGGAHREPAEDPDLEGFGDTGY